MELNHRLQHVGLVSCRLTTGSWSDRGRSRTDKITRLSTWSLCRFAYSAVVSCGGRIRTGVERLMRPCWKPDSSPLRSDQGESRTPTPVRARRSDRRVSTCSTTWPVSSPYGNRTHLSALKGQCPLTDRRTSCVVVLRQRAQWAGRRSNPRLRLFRPLLDRLSYRPKRKKPDVAVTPGFEIAR